MCIYILSIFVRLIAIGYLANFKSYNIEIRNRQSIIRTGPYKFIRHPIYLSMIIEAIVLPIAFHSYVGLAISGIIYLPIVALRLLIEEKAMLRIIGNEYFIYMKNTPRLLPRLRLKKYE